MSVENVKSASITNLEATPRVANQAGVGAPSNKQWVADSVVVPASASADSVLRVVRVPSTARDIHLIFESEAMGAGKFDVGVYKSNLTSFVAANATDQDFFATVIDCASAVARTDATNESGTYTLAKRKLPLWEAVGLTADPGCPFDIALTVKTTDVTTGAARAGLTVGYVV